VICRSNFQPTIGGAAENTAKTPCNQQAILGTSSLISESGSQWFLKGHNPCWHDMALLAYHLSDVAQDPDALGNPLIKMVWTSPLNSTSPAEEGSGLVGIFPSSNSTLILFCGASSLPGTAPGCAASISNGNKIKQTRNMFQKKFGTHIPKLTPPQSWHARMHVINSECETAVVWLLQINAPFP